MRQERQFPKVHLVGSFQEKGKRVFFWMSAIACC